MDLLYHVRNKSMSVFLWLFLHPFECYFRVYFPSCFATREINTKITLSWALKQLFTRVHSLFYINFSWRWTSPACSACANSIAMELISIKGQTGHDCVSVMKFIIFHVLDVQRTCALTSFLCAPKNMWYQKSILWNLLSHLDTIQVCHWMNRRNSIKKNINLLESAWYYLPPNIARSSDGQDHSEIQYSWV